MKKNVLKKTAAFALTATMIFGSSLTVLADANITATGGSTGHVERKVINVEFPTVATNDTTFNFTMDAERLITAAGNKLEGADVTLPTSNDTGVYFLVDGGGSRTVYTYDETKVSYKKYESEDTTVTLKDNGTDTGKVKYVLIEEKTDYEALAATVSGIVSVDYDNGEKCLKVYADDAFIGETVTAGKTYANTSKPITVTNKSSHSVEISATASVSATSGTAVTLSDSATISGTTPKLYLGLKVGSDTQAVTTSGATAKTIVAGVVNNFEVKSNEDGSFSYGLKTAVDEDSWKTTTISMEGAVNQVENVGNVVAPTIAITWTYAEAKPVKGGIFYDDSKNEWWLGTTAETGFTSGATIGDVTINDQPITASKQSYGGTDWVVVKWSDYAAAGYDQSAVLFNVKAEVDGIVYTAYHYYGTIEEAGLFYDTKTNDWWIGLTDEAGFTSGAELGTVTVNEQPITASVTSYGGTDWVVVKWSDYTAAGYDQTETEYDFVVVVGGQIYKAHYTYQ